MPINPIQYQETTQFQPATSIMLGMKFMQDRENAKAELEGAKLRNRLYDMSLKEAESKKAFTNEIANSLLTPQNVKNVTVTTPQQMTNMPLHGEGGIPVGWNSNNPAPAPGIDEQSVKLPQMTTEQFNAPEVQGMLKGMKYEAQDAQITPFLEEAKQYGITEQMLRSNPREAMAFIEKKKADATALMDKKVNMIKDLNTVNPTIAASIWNSDPVLAKMGKIEIAADGDIREVFIGGKLAGANVRTPDNKWNFVKVNEMTEYQKAMIEQKELDRKQRDEYQAESLQLRRDIFAGNADLRKELSQGNVYPTTFTDDNGTPLVIDRKGNMGPANVAPGTNPTPRPGALTPESAAKAQLVEQALGYMPTIRSLFLGDDKEPVVNRSNVANAAVRMPFTEGRKASTLILDAVEAKLRAESGAAVPETEVKRIAKRYIPQVGDNDSTIITKLNNMESFLSGTSAKINRGRTKPSGNKGGGSSENVSGFVKSLPSPAKALGKTAREVDANGNPTGRVFKSDGKNWLVVKK